MKHLTISVPELRQTNYDKLIELMRKHDQYLKIVEIGKVSDNPPVYKDLVLKVEDLYYQCNHDVTSLVHTKERRAKAMTALKDLTNLLCEFAELK